MVSWCNMDKWMVLNKNSLWAYDGRNNNVPYSDAFHILANSDFDSFNGFAKGYGYDRDASCSSSSGDSQSGGCNKDPQIALDVSGASNWNNLLYVGNSKSDSSHPRTFMGNGGSCVFIRESSRVIPDFCVVNANTAGCNSNVGKYFYFVTENCWEMLGKEENSRGLATHSNAPGIQVDIYRADVKVHTKTLRIDFGKENECVGRWDSSSAGDWQDGDIIVLAGSPAPVCPAGEGVDAVLGKCVPTGPAPPCLAGLYLDAALGYCVSCRTPYVESLPGSEAITDCYYYTTVVDQAIQGYNDEQYKSSSGHTISIALCKERCAARATCESFDYMDDDVECNIADVNCADAGSACKQTYTDFTYYEIHRYPAGGGGGSTLSSGLLAHYDFEDTAALGKDVVDASGTRDVAVVSGQTSEIGKVGAYAIKNAGTNQQFTIGDWFDLSQSGTADGLAIAFWAKVKTHAAYQPVFQSWPITGSTSWTSSTTNVDIITNPNNNLYHMKLDIYGSSGVSNGCKADTSTAVSSTNTDWHHYVIGYDNSGAFRGWVDGTEQTFANKDASKTCPADITTYLPAGMRIRFGGDTNRYVLDDVRLYERMLTQSEIGELVAMGSSS